jgi:hypothetical protein
LSRQEKLLQRITSKPKDFTWSELRTLMASLGVQLTKGSGSTRKFINPATDAGFNIHEPHPSNILKRYQVHDAIDFLKKEGFIS